MGTASREVRIAALDQLIEDLKVYMLEKQAISDWLDGRLAHARQRIESAVTADEKAPLFNVRRGLLAMHQQLAQQRDYYQEQCAALEDRLAALQGPSP